MSTLPKSVQAQMGSSGDEHSGEISSRERIQQLKEFAQQYKKLPDDFLRIPIDPSRFELDDVRPIRSSDIPLADIIDISVIEAQLVKNYGLLRMDLYCRVRVGHFVCTTVTCPNCAKNPKWVSLFQFNLEPGINSFHLDIYDEKQFSQDEKVAWLHEAIPPEVFRGVTVERWFPLSGKLGEDKEGSILLVLSHKKVPAKQSAFGHPRSSTSYQQQMPLVIPPPQSMSRGGPIIMNTDSQVPAYVQPMPPPSGQGPHTMIEQMMPGPHPDPSPVTHIVRPVTDEDVDQLSEMFPSISKAVIKSVLENNNNDKEAAISSLLSLA